MERRISAAISFLDLRTLIKYKLENQDNHGNIYLSKLLDRLLFVSIVPHGLDDFAKLPWGIFIVKGMSSKTEKSSFSKMSKFFWMTPSCSKSCADQMIWRCVHGQEALDILEDLLHWTTGGHSWMQNLTPKRMSRNFEASGVQVICPSFTSASQSRLHLGIPIAYLNCTTFMSGDCFDLTVPVPLFLT
ncbi:hypothetical protein Tco_0071903 [Tanacetum coccineum]